MARLIRVTDAVIAELDRQGVAEVMANHGFDPRGDLNLRTHSAREFCLTTCCQNIYMIE
jgi:hypothetical protein